MKTISKALKIFMAFLLVAVIFIIVFPIMHKVEVNEPTDIKTDGKFVDIGDGVTIHYKEYGQGEPLLLIHGYTSNSYTWNDVAPELAKHYRVITPDVVGFGLSSKPEDGNYNYEGFANYLAEFLDKIGVGKVNIGGNSMGGGISIRFALDHPERVKKMILIDSAGIAHDRKSIIFTMLSTPGINSFFGSLNSPFFTAFSLREMAFYDDSLVTPEKAQAYFVPFTTKGTLNAAARTMKENDWGGLEARLPEITTPTLIIWGDKDALIAPPLAYVFNKQIPGSELLMLEKCGHMPQEEMPAKTAAAMISFLGK